MLYKNKLKRIVFPITIVFFIYLLSLTFGYAILEETLTINGVASTIEYYVGSNLPTEKIKLSSENYYRQNTTKTGLTFVEESWSDDTYTVHMKKEFLLAAGESTIEYSVAFNNPTVLDYTVGEVTTEIIENTGDMLKDANTTISSLTIKPGEPCTITMTFHTNITWRYNTETAKATVSYMFYGERRYFYFIVTYTT